MGRVRVKIGAPKIYEFGSSDLMIDIDAGDIYFKDRRGKLRKILSQDNTPSTTSLPILEAPTVSASFGIITKNITASGDISASGIIYANTFESHGSAEIGVSDSINVTGGISSSGNISASGEIHGNTLNLTNNGDNTFSVTSAGAVSASSTLAGTALTVATNGVTKSTIDTSGNIVAEGNISSSGTIFTDNLRSGNGTISTQAHLVPQADNTFDLGSASTRWRDLHIFSSSVRFYDGTGEIGAISFERGRGVLMRESGDADAAETILSASAVRATGNVVSKASVIALTGSFNVIEGGVF